MYKDYLLRAAIPVAAVLGVAVSAPSADAATIMGAIDIGGEVTVESTSDLTGVDFVGDGTVLASAGDFGSLTTGTPVTLTDILFSNPSDIWSVGGFTFAADAFQDIAPNLQGGKDFTATGVLTAAGFDDTPGTFFFSSQTSGVLASFSSSSIPSPIPIPATGLLLLAALGSAAAFKRRKAA